MRLDKLMSDLGVASRKELKQIIKSGRVSVNGDPVREPDMKLDPENDEVALDGRPLSYRRFRYFAVDKPEGLLTACEDKKQKTVMDILPEQLRKLDLFPVGRLDKDTTGLLLLTNDGEYAHKVISPKYRIEKVYYAETDGAITNEDIALFASGVVLRDGLHCLPAKLEAAEPSPCAACYVTVMEGKYHQVKRMLASVGKPVIHLRRLSIGNLELGSLQFDGDSCICELSQEQANLVFAEK
ncbi:MAG: pseudouridine synthase [Eubacteriales bacterium]|nr:pseudouridine synthase [Eubacteriales bacterium]